MAFKMKGSPMHRNFGIGSPAKNRITDLTGMTDKEKQNATAHNDAHAKEAASGLKHKMDDWGFAHDNKNHRGTTGAGKTAPGHSALKQTYDVNGVDERADNIDQNQYDKWRGTEDINTGNMEDGDGKAPNIRYLGQKENKKFLDQYLAWKKSGAELPTTKKKGTTTKVKDPGGRETGTETKTTTTVE